MRSTLIALLLLAAVSSPADCLLRDQAGLRSLLQTSDNSGFVPSSAHRHVRWMNTIDVTYHGATDTATVSGYPNGVPLGTLAIVDVDRCVLVWSWVNQAGRSVSIDILSTIGGPALPASCGSGCTTTRQRQGPWLGLGTASVGGVLVAHRMLWGSILDE